MGPVRWRRVGDTVPGCEVATGLADSYEAPDLWPEEVDLLFTHRQRGPECVNELYLTR